MYIHPVSCTNRSSTFGIGNLSSFATGFTVCLKSPQIWTLFLSGLITAMIGDAHSAICTGSLSEIIPSQVIKEVNEIVKQSTQNGSTKCNRGTYQKFTLTQQAQAAKYAVENGNQVAIRRYSKEFCAEIKESTLSTWNLSI